MQNCFSVMRALRVIVLGIGTLSVFPEKPVWGQAGARLPAAQQLELEEWTAIPLPRGTAVLGGLLNRDGSAVFWTPADVWLVANLNAPPTLACSGMHVSASYGVSRDVPLRVTFYEAVSRSLVDMDTAGLCVRRLAAAFDSTESLVAAIGSRWIQLAAPRGKPPTVRTIGVVSERAEHLDTLRLPETARLGDVADLSVRGGDALLVCESSFPFRVYQIDAGRNTRVLLDPTVGLGASDRASLASWTAFPPVHLDRGYLQMLADSRSDHRRLVLADENGKVLHESTVDVALGFLDVDTRRRILLAVRNAGAPELVVYRWHWRAPER